MFENKKGEGSMSNKKILVTYYSRSGTTKNIGGMISDILKCDLEEIHDTKKRKGFLGFIIAGRDSMFKRETVIESIKKDPAEYDLVIIGTPVWASNLTPAIRTYINSNKDKFKQVAFFNTLGGSDGEKVLDIMEELCGKGSLARLSLSEKIVKKESHKEFVNTFTHEVMDKADNI